MRIKILVGGMGLDFGVLILIRWFSLIKKIFVERFYQRPDYVLPRDVKMLNFCFQGTRILGKPEIDTLDCESGLC